MSTILSLHIRSSVARVQQTVSNVSHALKRKVQQIAQAIFAAFSAIYAFFSQRLFRSKPMPSVQPVLPLEKTGGMVNGGNTCYMAAVLQALKTSPFIWTYLNEDKHPLTRQDNETPEHYETRRQIRGTVADMMRASLRGETVPAERINHLRQLFINCGSHLSPGGAEDPRDFLVDLYTFLEIPRVKLKHLPFKVGEPVPPQLYSSYMIWANEETFSDELQRVQLEKTPPFVLFTSPTLDHYPLDPPANIQIACEDQNEPVRYQFTSMVSCAGHAITYAKNKQNEWVVLDDHVVGKFDNRPTEQEKKDTLLYFYTRL